MKRYLYVLYFLVVIGSINACKKNDDPVADLTVGSWKLDRIRTSGIPAPFSTVYPNTDNDPALFGYQDSFITKTDKTFTGTLRTGGQVIDYNGSWESTGTTLTLKDDKGNSDTYTLDATKTPNQLLGTVIAASDSLTNPTTKKLALVNYSVQLIYARQ